MCLGELLMGVCVTYEQNRVVGHGWQFCLCIMMFEAMYDSFAWEEIGFEAMDYSFACK
jgi:hypothetical protein